ncbi:MAG: T9SS type A sorting domain-containing protein, partial [bacterium]
YTVAKHNDVGVAEIGVSPANINQNVQFTVVLANYGIDNQADVQSLFRIYNSSGTVVHSGGLTPWPSINAGQRITRTITWRPTVPDTYTIKCWTGLLTDEDRSNDTLAVRFTIHSVNIFELGFDDGVTDTMLDTTGTVSWRFLGASDVAGDGVGVKFVAPSYDSLTIWKVKAYLGSMAPFDIQFYSATPSGEPGSAIGSPIPVAAPAGIERFSEYLVNRPIGRDATFFILLLNANEGQMVSLGMDRTLPHDGNSWAYVASMGGFINLSSITRYADVDLMLRVYLFTGTSVTLDEEGKVIPKFELHSNYPNPFNLGTTISFSIPQKAQTKLEIFNSLGERVATLLDEEKEAGYYAFRFSGIDKNGKPLPSGLYFYKLTSGNSQAVKSMILMK